MKHVLAALTIVVGVCGLLVHSARADYVYRGKPCKVEAIIDSATRNITVSLTDGSHTGNVDVKITDPAQASNQFSTIDDKTVGATGQVAFEVGFMSLHEIQIYDVDPKYPPTLGGAGLNIAYYGMMARVLEVMREKTQAGTGVSIRFQFTGKNSPAGTFAVRYDNRGFLDSHTSEHGMTTVTPALDAEGILYLSSSFYKANGLKVPYESPYRTTSDRTHQRASAARTSKP